MKPCGPGQVHGQRSGLAHSFRFFSTRRPGVTVTGVCVFTYSLKRSVSRGSVPSIALPWLSTALSSPPLARYSDRTTR